MSWITIPNWERFQHYGLYRRPPWIKNYTELLRKDEYLDLPFAARGLLHGIWLAYADRDGRLRKADLPATLLGRARDAHLASLNHAGLIDFCASRPLPLSLRQEHSVESTGAPATPPPVETRQNAGAYKPVETTVDFEVDEAMLQLARGWLNP